MKCPFYELLTDDFFLPTVKKYNNIKPASTQVPVNAIIGVLNIILIQTKT